jgi:hypothetical protein
MTTPTSSLTRWDDQQAIGTIALSNDVVMLVARCRLRDHWFVTLRTLRRAQPPAEGWTLRSQVVMPTDKVAGVCALLQRAVERTLQGR